MKISLLLVGKTTDRNFIPAIEEYVGRIKHFNTFEVTVIPELKNAKSMSFEQQKEKEADMIMQQLQQGDYIVLLDEKGKEFRSTEFSAWLENRLNTSGKRIVFVVGGPYGFSSRIYDAANEKISMSKMTFSHQMIRLIFTEQLYRAFTIMKGMPYHHE